MTLVQTPLGEPAPDVLGAPYVARTIALRPDDEGEVVATLVSRLAGDSPGPRAVLHVHGFCDYFFQTVAADFWVSRGYDFHALDLRKYGRSWRPHQTPNYVADLATYAEELDVAWAQLSSYDTVVLSGHSTGGLTLSLWLHHRGHRPAGVVLNAPWLDMQGTARTRHLLLPLVDRLGVVQPMRMVPREVSGYYARSLHRDHRGEWDFDLAWKPVESFPVYAGWLRAIRTGHARVAQGLEVLAPVLVLASARSGHPTSVDDPATHGTDIVLDVEQIRRRAPLLGRHVTTVMVEGALHDVTLSRRPARDEVFDQLGRWLSAYVDR